MTYTAAEASAITGLSTTAIHKAIDRGLVKPVSATSAGRTARLLSREHLVFLWLEAHGLSSLPLAERRAIARTIVADPQAGDIPAPSGDSLVIRHRTARAHVLSAIRMIAKARQMAISDPEIQRGDPVYRGTRIPVSLIASMLGQGATVDEIEEGYPALTRGQIELAPMYVRAFPRRGRPPVRPWVAPQPVPAARARTSRNRRAA